MHRMILSLAGASLACGVTTARSVTTAAPSTASAPSRVAVATLVDAANSQIGVATLTDSAGATSLSVSVSGLAPGLHGMHVHSQGACTPPGFESAGPHFNPDEKQHGTRNPEGPHAGDLPNLLAGPNGSADTTMAVSAGLTSGPHSVLQPGGTAIVIHTGPDDEMTDPSGNSGSRIACGVFRAP
jgi:Cu-Zn family superoxide dismutase